LINLNTDLASLQQIAISNKNIENAKVLGENHTKIIQATKPNDSENSSATKVEVSENATSSIDDAIAQEELLSQKINFATNIHDTLGSVRSEISSILSDLQNPDVEYCIEDLEKLDNAANDLIEKILFSLRQNNASCLVSTDYLGIYINGLNSLKNLKISDIDFTTKFETLKENVKKEQDVYNNITEKLYANLSQNAATIENSQKFSTSQNTNSESIQKNIITNIEETLKSTCSKLTPETVARLLQG